MDLQPPSENQSRYTGRLKRYALHSAPFAIGVAMGMVIEAGTPRTSAPTKYEVAEEMLYATSLGAIAALRLRAEFGGEWRPYINAGGKLATGVLVGQTLTAMMKQYLMR